MRVSNRKKMKNMLKGYLSVVFIVVGVSATNSLSDIYTLNSAKTFDQIANTKPGGGPRTAS
jgi:hypothetical protein